MTNDRLLAAVGLGVVAAGAAFLGARLGSRSAPQARLRPDEAFVPANVINLALAREHMR